MKITLTAILILLVSLQSSIATAALKERPSLIRMTYEELSLPADKTMILRDGSLIRVCLSVAEGTALKGGGLMIRPHISLSDKIRVVKLEL